jgi:hypothetical protein
MPQPFLRQAQQMLDAEPTIKVVQFVLEKMDLAGENGREAFAIATGLLGM